VPIVSHSLETVGFEEVERKELAPLCVFGAAEETGEGIDFLHASVFQLSQGLVQYPFGLCSSLTLLRSKAQEEHRPAIGRSER
jgi:hypothetical protein